MDILKHSLFSTCLSQLFDISLILSSCINDFCQDQSSINKDRVLCRTITTLAYSCSSINITVDWMTNPTLSQYCRRLNYSRCELISGSVYSECISNCKSSCTDFALMDEFCTHQCIPGCQCPMDEYYDSNLHRCQKRQNCSCYDLKSEQYVLANNFMAHSHCYCTNGSLQCSSIGHEHCYGNQVFSTNTSLCPRTCLNYMSYYDCGRYASGCTCRIGEILIDSASNRSQCVPISECPCQYGGQFHVENSVIVQSDQQCTCLKGGIWSCKKIISTKTCTLFGASNYRTFDDLYFTLLSPCQYVIVREENNRFQILSENVPCGAHGTICSKNIHIQYNNVTVNLLRDRSVLINSIPLKNYENQPVIFDSIHVYQSGIYTMIKTNDFRLRWNGQTYIEIEIQSDQHVDGLCGNNNDNSDDDSIRIDGQWSTSISCSMYENRTKLIDPCGDSHVHEQRRSWAQTRCEAIRIRSSMTNNPFDRCIQKLESNLIDDYYQACLQHACQ